MTLVGISSVLQVSEMRRYGVQEDIWSKVLESGRKTFFLFKTSSSEGRFELSKDFNAGAYL